MNDKEELGRLFDPDTSFWLNKDDEPDVKANAILVPRKTWRAMYSGFDFIPRGEDEIMREMNAPMLPGFEG